MVGALALVAGLIAIWSLNRNSNTPEKISSGPESAGETFRVVGVRPDGTKVKLQGGLSDEKARDLHRRLQGTKDFTEILIEPETQIEGGKAD